MSKVIGPPQSGRVGNVVYRMTKTGLVASQLVVPRNPRLPKQQLGRAKFGIVSGYWRALSPEDQEAWCLGGADPYTMSRLGRTAPLSGFHYYARINNARPAIGLSRFNRPPPIPSFGLNTTGPLAITITAGVITLKLPVVSLPTQYTSWWRARPLAAPESVTPSTTPSWVSCPSPWTAGATSRRFTLTVMACPPWAWPS